MFILPLCQKKAGIKTVEYLHNWSVRLSHERCKGIVKATDTYLYYILLCYYLDWC